MVGIRRFIVSLTFFMFAVPLWAADITQESTMFKGFFGESFVDNIWQTAGRIPISDKINPVLNGPDKIYRFNGIIEIHEVKAYTSWAGKSAMKTTIKGNPSYELSHDWVNNWIQKTLTSQQSSASEIVSAKEVQQAISLGKCRFILDEVNLTTRQFRYSEVVQLGTNDVTLKELGGPMRLRYFERHYAQEKRGFIEYRAGNVEKFYQQPKMTKWTKGHPLTRADFENIVQQSDMAEWSKDYPLTRADFEKLGKELPDLTPAPGLITPEGRLLVAVKTGGKTSLLVFGIDGGIATYSYVKGDINFPEYEEKLWDAAIKGTAVGSCTAVTVFLGAAPAGPVVAAVSVGAYLITDQVVTVWRENQKRKFLTVEDLKAWGFELDSVLALPVDSNLVLPKNTTLEMPVDSTLQIRPDSNLAL